MRKCLLIISALTSLLSATLLPDLLHAQTTVKPERLTIKNGLSQNFVSAMLQDSEGFLWIGTKNGLNRYVVKILKNERCLSSLDVWYSSINQNKFKNQ